MNGPASALAFLRGPPVAIQFRKRQVLDILAIAVDDVFHIAKTPLELAVGVIQCLFCIHAQVACQVNGREQQVTELFVNARRFALLNRLFQLHQLFMNFCVHTFRVRPVETHACGALAELLGTLQSRQRQSNPGERAVIRASSALLLLDLLPAAVDLAVCPFLGSAKNMRMPCLLYTSDAADDLYTVLFWVVGG